MPKHFTNFPEELERYNPELLQSSNFANLETFDSQKLLHSFNDEPSFLSRSSESMQYLEEFIWHKHGVPYREDSKPPMIFTKANDSYITYNDKKQMTSFDDKPAYITYSLENHAIWLEWHKDGQVHRDDDLPAVINCENGKIIETIYYRKGLIHRSNGLPAHKSPTYSKWMLNGGLHSIKGPALISTGQTRVGEPFRWALFGVELPQDVFNSIITFQKQNDIPLWVAFLCVLGVITKSDANTFKKGSKTWDFKVPLEWQLRALGVTDETFRDRINSYSHPDDFSFKIGYGSYPLALFKISIEPDLERLPNIRPQRGINA